MTENTLLFAAATMNPNDAIDIAQEAGGTALIDERPDTTKLPFAGIALVVTDDLNALTERADGGLHLVCKRTIKPGAANVYGLYPLVHHPDLTHQQTDAHWRDNHGPLALEHHAYMTHYVQLSVVQTLAGRPLDGIALCGFDSVSDLKDRFYTVPASEQVIAEDIAKFADLRKSPRGLTALPTGAAL